MSPTLPQALCSESCPLLVTHTCQQLCVRRSCTRQKCEGCWQGPWISEVTRSRRCPGSGGTWKARPREGVPWGPKTSLGSRVWPGKQVAALCLHSQGRRKGGTAGGMQGSGRVMAVRLSLRHAASWVPRPRAGMKGTPLRSLKTIKTTAGNKGICQQRHPSKFDNPVAVGETPDGCPPPMSLKKRPPESPVRH